MYVIIVYILKQHNHCNHHHEKSPKSTTLYFGSSLLLTSLIGQYKLQNDKTTADVFLRIRSGTTAIVFHLEIESMQQ